MRAFSRKSMADRIVHGIEGDQPLIAACYDMIVKQFCFGGEPKIIPWATSIYWTLAYDMWLLGKMFGLTTSTLGLVLGTAVRTGYSQ